MAEILINLKSNDYESRKLAKYEFSKLNMTELTSLEQINEELLRLQKELSIFPDEYKDVVRRLETFRKILNRQGLNWRNGHDREVDKYEIID